MNTLPFQPAVIASQHLNGFGPDDFICLGLIALVLVVATFVVRGGEKNEEGKTTRASSDGSAEK